MLPRAWSVVVFSLLAAAGWAEERVALVIGNGDYEGPAALKNPANDSTAIAGALGKLGFKVTHKTDVDLPTLEKNVLSFSRSLKKESVALFFYAGHGIQVKGENFLVPVKTDVDEEFQVKQKCYKVDFVLEAMEASEAALKVMVLDCCRDNPFARSWTRATGGQGLATIAHIPDGTLIAFSTSPGRTALDGRGDNSPYTRHLVAGLVSRPKEGLELTEVFREASRNVKRETGQIPWLNLEASLEKYYLWRHELDVAAEAKMKADFDAALELHQNGEFADAESAWVKFTSENGGSARLGEALAYLGDGLFRLEKFTDAEEQLTAALTHNLPATARAGTLYRLGECRYRQGQLEFTGQSGGAEHYRRAIEPLADLIKNFPQARFIDHALLLRAICAARLGEYAETLRDTDVLLRKFPQSSYRSEALFREAEVTQLANRPKDAITAFDRYLREATERTREDLARYLRAECQFRLQYYSAAEAEMLRASKNKSVDFADRAYLYHAECVALGGKRYAESAVALESLPKLFPDSAIKSRALVRAGRYYEHAKRDGDALRLYQQVLDQKSDNYSEAACLTGWVLSRQKKPNESATIAAGALARDPKGPWTAKLNAVWADGLYDTGRKAEALILYGRILDKYADDTVAPTVNYRCIYLCRELKKYPEAIKYATDFAQRFPDHARTKDARTLLEDCQKLAGVGGKAGTSNLIVNSNGDISVAAAPAPTVANGNNNGNVYYNNGNGFNNYYNNNYYYDDDGGGYDYYDE